MTCDTCGREFRTTEGTIQLMPDRLADETALEQRIRDDEARIFGREEPVVEGPGDSMAVKTTLKALRPHSSHHVLELGAGTGRFTRLLLNRCASVTALDVSLASLRILRGRLDPTERLVTVQADATTTVYAPAGFDRVLSTLVSNLPDAEHRARMYWAVARALRPGGIFVFTAHHFGLRARLNGESPTGRYKENGVYREFFTVSQLIRELQPYFRTVRARPVSVLLPGTPRWRARAHRVNSAAESLPGLRAFGQLVLVEARDPIVTEPHNEDAP